jgi:catechol 2,3-dioxygenase-like lactoylglutathione lyase family enzyme
VIIAIDHVQLAAPPGSEDTLRRYYTDILGLEEIPKPPVLAARGGCWFQTPGGGVQLHLGVETPFVPPPQAPPALRIQGIHAYAEHIAALGAPVTWDADLPGHHRFYSSDPVGNRIEFLEPTQVS